MEKRAFCLAHDDGDLLALVDNFPDIHCYCPTIFSFETQLDRREFSFIRLLIKYYLIHSNIGSLSLYFSTVFKYQCQLLMSFIFILEPKMMCRAIFYFLKMESRAVQLNIHQPFIARLFSALQMCAAHSFYFCLTLSFCFHNPNVLCLCVCVCG